MFNSIKKKIVLVGYEGIQFLYEINNVLKLVLNVNYLIIL